MKYNLPHPEPFRIICLYLIRKFDGQQEQSRMLFFGNDLSKVSWGPDHYPLAFYSLYSVLNSLFPKCQRQVLYFLVVSKANLLP